jgi:hypothetical protein
MVPASKKLFEAPENADLFNSEAKTLVTILSLMSQLQSTSYNE